MYTKQKPQTKTMEAFLDGELTPSEQRELQALLQSEPDLQSELSGLQQEQSLVQGALKARTDEAIASIDWDAFSNNVMAQVALEEAPVAPAKTETETQSTSWFGSLQNLLQWVRLHPGVSLSCTAMAGILMIVSFTFMDPGPNPDSTVLVDKISNIKTAQVSVMQSKNKATGKNMTVIIVNEPIFDDNPPSKNNTRRLPPKKDGTTAP